MIETGIKIIGVAAVVFSIAMLVKKFFGNTDKEQAIAICTNVSEDTTRYNIEELNTYLIRLDRVKYELRYEKYLECKNKILTRIEQLKEQ